MCSLVCTHLLVVAGKGCVQMQGEQSERKKCKTDQIRSTAQAFVPRFQHATMAPKPVKKKSKDFVGKVKGGIAKPTKRKTAQQGVAADPEGGAKRTGVAEPSTGRRQKLKGPCDKCLVGGKNLYSRT